MLKSNINNAIFSTAYLPPVEYFVYLLLSDNIFIETHETYPKQTYRNRCYISGSNGVESLHIPVIKPRGKHSKTNEVLISYKQSWQRNHWRAINTAYSNAPFFIYYKDFLESFYDKRFEKLLDFNTRLLNSLLSEIGIKKQIYLTDNFEREPGGCIDFRTVINPKTKTPASLHSIPFHIYDQVFIHKYGFVENLSIIDLLFNKGPDTKEYLSDCANAVNTIFLKDMQS